MHRNTGARQRLRTNPRELSLPPTTTTGSWAPMPHGVGGMVSPAEYKNRTTHKSRLTVCPPTPSSPGETSLVHPQLLRQILKSHQHNRIIAAHQRRLTHPGPHRPTLTMLQLHNQIRQRLDVRRRA
jgi:hypothetical protein